MPSFLELLAADIVAAAPCSAREGKKISSVPSPLIKNNDPQNRSKILNSHALKIH
jgi:hypothetical protein